MSNVYTIFNAAINGTSLGGITRQRVSRGIQELIQGASGGVDPTWAGQVGQAPEFEFDTVHVATALGLIGISGLAISANVVLGFQKKESGATRASGSSHVKATMAAGLIVPTRISASQGKEATYSIAVHGVSADGVNSPMTIQGSQTLSGVQACDEKFTVGPIVINGTTYQTQDMSIDFGLSVQKKQHSGLIYPTAAWIEERKPNVTVTLNDMAGLTCDGTITNVVLYLRSLDTPASAESAHIKFTFTAGLYYSGDAEGSHAADASCPIELRPVWDQSNAIMQIATAQAIA